MDLNGLIYGRMAGNETIVSKVAEYGGHPAIFNDEFPADQQEGWEGDIQYPRIMYQYNLQANMERSSDGTLRIMAYALDQAVVDELEEDITGCLRDVLMQPTDGVPVCVAWAGSTFYVYEGSEVVGKEIRFDIVEYPDQITTDPDPVAAMQADLKEAFPDLYVIGQETVSDYRVADEDEPIVYVKMLDYNTDHLTFAMAWINCRLAIHVIAPTAESRIKWVRLINNYLSVAGSMILSDETPLLLRQTQARNTADYLKTGQITVEGTYTLPRLRDNTKMIDHIHISRA